MDSDNDQEMIHASGKLINIIAKSLSEAVGDDIRADVKRNGLITENGTPGRMWDYLNTHVCNNLEQENMLGRPTKRGPWAMVPIIEKDTGFIYSIMTESRFRKLKKTKNKRSRAHYVDALAQTFNLDLPGQERILIDSEMPVYFDDEYVGRIIEGIFHDLRIPRKTVQRHALVLFSYLNHVLTSLRCCIINDRWEIVCRADWSNYIQSSESAVVEEVADPTSAPNNPAHGLQFTAKAKARIGQKRLAEKKRDRKQKMKVNKDKNPN